MYISKTGPEDDMDPFTFGKEKAATDMVGIFKSIPDPKNRLHAFRWTQTALSRFGRGLNAIRLISNVQAKFEVTVLWRKHWIAQVDKKGTIPPEIKSHIRSIMVGRTKEVIRIVIAEIAASKNKQRSSSEVPTGSGEG